MRAVLKRYAFKNFQAKLTFLDGDGEVITVDQFSLGRVVSEELGEVRPVNILTATLIDYDGELLRDDSIKLTPRQGVQGQFIPGSWFIMAPVFFGQLGDYRVDMPIAREMTLTLDEVQRTRRITCEVVPD